MVAVSERKGTMMSELEYTKAQLVFFYIIVLLSLDSINPVKIFTHVFPVEPWQIATLAIACWVYTFIVNIIPLLYYAAKTFFHSILSIFFSDIQVVGMSNVPAYGPVIFTSNHANQFMDGITILCTCQRTISYLVADKSWNRPIVGHLAWALGAVPVKRAQDSAKTGTGRLCINTKQISDDADAIKVVGLLSSKFTTEIKPGDKIRFLKTALAIKVASVESDDSMTLKVEEGVIDVINSLSFPDQVGFDILPRIDQAKMYHNVLEKLASGGTIGIFPEGGSHDRTDLLPLKAGVALIAYAGLEKDGVNVPIVPVGLNYFRAHRFRGKATVEFGSPTYVDPSTLEDYKKGGADKRRVCNELLGRIENSMRSVLVSTDDYEMMKMVHTARRLYREDGVRETAEERQNMGRRFAEAFKRILLQVKGEPPEEWLELQKRMSAYQKELDELGIRDYQVVGLDHEEAEGHTKGETVLYRMKVIGNIVHLLFLSVLAAVPSILLNLPVGLFARAYANRRRKKALAASKVKLKAFDVVLSERVICCIALVPTLWIIYGLLLVAFTNFDWPTLAVIAFCFPLFSYWSVRATESGMVDIKDLRPYVMQLIPSARKRLARLPAIRRALRADLRAMVRKIGPSLGDLYYEKELDWTTITSDTRRMSLIQSDVDSLKAVSGESADAKKDN